MLKAMHKPVGAGKPAPTFWIALGYCLLFSLLVARAMSSCPTVADGISTEDLLVNLSETLASANALSCDLAFNLEGSKREELLGVAQLIELVQLLADSVHKGCGPATTAA
jgi:hypothetical protein